MISCTKGRPSVCVIDRLSANTYYRVSFDIPVPGLVKSGFTTLPSHFKLKNHDARFAVVSGNSFSAARDDIPHGTDLWRELYRHINGRYVDYVLHLGNNVYVDSDKYKAKKDTKTYEGPLSDCPYLEAVRFMESLPPSDWEGAQQRVKEMFRNAYRATWNHATTKHCLANCPNIFILDDHEIEDGVGFWTKHRDEHSLEYYLNCCAYDVYNEYCRQLFEDYPKFKNPLDVTKVGQAYHFHAFGDIGIVMLDTRLPGAIHRDHNPLADDMYPMLGNKQWTDLEFALSMEGYLSKVKMLVVCSASPVALCGEQGFLQKATCGKKDGFESSWNSPANMGEASLLLHKLFDWRAEKPGVRNFVLACGNGVQGGLSDIIDLRYYRGDERLARCKQVTVGAIGNVYDHKPVANLKSAGCGVNGLGVNHQFAHYRMTNARNFAMLYIPPVSFGAPSYEIRHYTASEKKKERTEVTPSSYLKSGCFGGSPTLSTLPGQYNDYQSQSKYTTTSVSSYTSSRDHTATKSSRRYSATVSSHKLH